MAFLMNFHGKSSEEIAPTARRRCNLGILLLVSCSMRILFAISILSFLILLWAALAIARRIRASHKVGSSSPTAQPEFSQYLFSAAEGANNPPPPAASPSSSQNLSASKDRPADPSHTNSYNKATSTERG